MFMVLCCVEVVLATNQLKMVVLVHRHGDRAPSHQEPNIPDSEFQQDWPLGKGQLTGTGMDQLFTLGKSLREMYVGASATHQNFLPSSWNANYYSALSTDVPRTLQSATSFAFGLYPPGTGPQDPGSGTGLPMRFQPVPVSTVPENEDQVLNGLGWGWSNCPSYRAFFEAAESSPEWKAKEAEVALLLSQLSSIVQMNVTLSSFSGILDSVQCAWAHKYYKEFPGVTQDMLDQLTELRTWYLNTMVGNKRMIACIGATQLMATIVSAMNDTQTGASQLRFLHLSGHDTTVYPLLAGLQAFDGKQPAYASHVVFELYEDEVKVSYQDAPLALPWCPGKEVGTCKWSTFANYFTSYCPVSSFNVTCTASQLENFLS